MHYVLILMWHCGFVDDKLCISGGLKSMKSYRIYMTSLVCFYSQYGNEIHLAVFCSALR